MKDKDQYIKELEAACLAGEQYLTALAKQWSESADGGSILHEEELDDLFRIWGELTSIALDRDVRDGALTYFVEGLRKNFIANHANQRYADDVN